MTRAASTTIPLGNIARTSNEIAPDKYGVTQLAPGIDDIRPRAINVHARWKIQTATGLLAIEANSMEKARVTIIAQTFGAASTVKHLFV
jgi:hypothetical protein